MTAPSPDDRATRLRELAAVFARLGIVAFGGPAAHVAMMEDEFVERRQWMSRQELLDLVAASNLIPGPNSTELAIHIGYARAGIPGLIVAGACFIVPAALIVGLLAAAYVQWGTLPVGQELMAWVQPVVLVIIFGALMKLAKTACRTRTLTMIAILAGLGQLALSMAGVRSAVLCVMFPLKYATNNPTRHRDTF